MKKIFSKPIVLSILIILLLIVINKQGWFNKLQDGFFHLTQPLQGNLYNLSLKFSDFTVFVHSIKQVKNENNQLRKEKEEFLSQLSRLNAVLEENKFLREQLSLSEPESRQLVLADVIGKDISGVGKYLLIDKGEKDSLKEGNVVITAGNILIGKIVETTQSFSTIQLITDYNSRVNATIQNSDINGLIKGTQQGLVIDLIPQSQELRTGDLIVSSGLAGKFPVNLLIGQIEEIISYDIQAFQKARVQPAVDVEKVKKVFVIKD